MSTYTKDDNVYWECLAPSLQELFKTLQSELSFFNRKLLSEIERAKAAEAQLEKELNDRIKEIFGIEDGEKGQVLRTNKSGLGLYCDDHCFLVQKNLDIDPDFFYEYDFETGTCKNNLGQTLDLPWRSFYYNPKSQKFWWYKFPGDVTEIKVTFSSADEVDDTQGAKGAMEVIDMGTDFYDGHIRYYKVYSNGWCEQGGAYAQQTSRADDPTLFFNNGLLRYVPLKKPYMDSKYIVTLAMEFCEQPNGYGHYNKPMNVLELEPDKFTALIDINNGGGRRNNYILYSNYRTEGFVDLVALGYKS